MDKCSTFYSLDSLNTHKEGRREVYFYILYYLFWINGDFIGCRGLYIYSAYCRWFLSLYSWTVNVNITWKQTYLKAEYISIYKRCIVTFCSTKFGIVLLCKLSIWFYSGHSHVLYNFEYKFAILIMHFFGQMFSWVQIWPIECGETDSHFQSFVTMEMDVIPLTGS